MDYQRSLATPATMALDAYDIGFVTSSFWVRLKGLAPGFLNIASAKKYGVPN